MAEDRTVQGHFQKIAPFGADVTTSSMRSPQGLDVDFAEDFQTALGAPSLSTFYKVTLDLAKVGSNAQAGVAGFREENSLEQYLTSCGVFDDVLSMRRFDLLATEAILPGASMALVQEVGSRQGITEKFATQRAYNDIAITYYIPADYTSLRLFQEWINFINALYFSSGGTTSTNGRAGHFNASLDRHGFHRFRYPNEYKKTMSITKFERNVGSHLSRLRNNGIDDPKKTVFAGEKFQPEAISYKFLNIFPTAVQDVALTYQNSTVLQVTVEFAYDRYVIISNKSEEGVMEETLPRRDAQGKGLTDRVLLDGEKAFQKNSNTTTSPLGTNDLVNVNSNIA